MEVILGMIITILIILLIIIFCIIAVINGVKNVVGREGMSIISYIFSNREKIMKEELNEPKTVSGMTRFYVPKIQEDFGDFSETVLFQMIESNLSKVFNHIENNNKVMDMDLDLVKDRINEQIEDLKGQKKRKEYNNIIFHKSAIKDYVKKDGIATITTSTSLEYMDENNRKIQTRYVCKFIHIYDYKLYKNNGKVFVIHCPNCGAPITNFNIQNCDYCKSKIGKVISKVWKFANYKDEYNN